MARLALNALLTSAVSNPCGIISMVELYYGSTTDFENLVAFLKATMKLQTVKGRSSIENLRISFNFVQL